jgi:hypothetical protein
VQAIVGLLVAPTSYRTPKQLDLMRCSLKPQQRCKRSDSDVFTFENSQLEAFPWSCDDVFSSIEILQLQALNVRSPTGALLSHVAGITAELWNPDSRLSRRGLGEFLETNS